MVLISKPYEQNFNIRLEDHFCLVDKELTIERYVKSIYLHLTTSQARQIVSFLESQIEEEPADNVGIALVLHTGKCA